VPCGGLAVEDGVDLCGNLTDCGHPVDPAEDSSRLVEGQDRLGLGAIFREPRPDGLFVVVVAPLELMAAANVAGVVDLRQLEAVVIGRAAACAGEAAGDPFDQRLLTNSPASITALACWPTGEPSRTAARSMSPVDS